MNMLGKAAEDEAELNLREIVLRAWQMRAWLAAALVSFTGAFGTVALLMKPVYRATVVAIPVSNSSSSLNGTIGSALGSLGGLASIAGFDLRGGGGDVDEALAVLRSRAFLESFIQARDLLPILYSDNWDSRASTWRDSDDVPTAAQAYKYLRDEVISVSQDKKTSLISLTVDWYDPQVAADWANDLINRLNTEMRSRALRRAEASVQFLNSELARTSLVGTKDAISNLIEAQINQQMLANVLEEYAVRVVDNAMPPDENDPIRPNKVLMVVIGALSGFFVGMLAVLTSAMFTVRQPMK